jgi:hypothetical protein
MASDRDDIFYIVHEFFRLGKFLKGVNVSHVALVPKTKLPTKFSEYRPISLVHDLYKIIEKLLSNRLRQVMPSIISANQTTFISGRF